MTLKEATYQLKDGVALIIDHHGEQVQLEPDVPVSRPIPPQAPQPPPRQPPGREPLKWIRAGAQGGAQAVVEARTADS